MQYWLAELDRYGNPKLVDGPHSEEAGAHEAFYLFQRLGFSKDRKFAVAKVEFVDAVPNKENVNEEALNTLNSIGLR